MVGRFSDLTGQRFGMLTVLRQAKSMVVKNGTRAQWECLCDCGQMAVRTTGAMRTKNPNCGCSAYSWVKRHGHSYDAAGKRSSTYTSWQNMIARCTNSSNPAFDHYDRHGIVVWDGWRSFEQFLSDMGEAPAGTTIERVDNEGNYEPGNCRWATRRDQANNRRTNVKFEYRGSSYTLAELARATGRPKENLRARLIRPGGWSVERAVETPTLPRGKTLAASGLSKR